MNKLYQVAMALKLSGVPSGEEELVEAAKSIFADYFADEDLNAEVTSFQLTELDKKGDEHRTIAVMLLSVDEDNYETAEEVDTLVCRVLDECDEVTEWDWRGDEPVHEVDSEVPAAVAAAKVHLADLVKEEPEEADDEDDEEEGGAGHDGDGEPEED